MKNYFQIFNLPESFAIDEAQLETHYLELQKQFHPDKLVTKPEGERLVLASLSVDINDGYHILKSSLLRSEYLLLQSGIIVNQDARDTVKPSPLILMAAMENHENLDDCTTLDEVKALEKQTKTRIKESESALISYYAEEPKNLEKAAFETINLKYLTKFLEDIKQRAKKLK
jgi:molecular chaperone HscB